MIIHFLFFVFHFLSPWMECMLRIVRNDSSESPWMEWQITVPYVICISHVHVGRMLRIVRNDSSESPWMEWQITVPYVICTSHVHVGRMLRIVRNDSSTFFISMGRMAGNCSIRDLHFPRTCGLYAKNRLQRFQCIFHSAGKLP